MLNSEMIQWPTMLDMTREECRRVLRKLELTAYSGVVSAFRGQGELSKEKRRLLSELAAALGVPADRHRAEVRRAANDESLNTIAHRLAGAGTRTDWAVEGRRVVPVLPRGRPVTAYTAVADASRTRADRLASRLSAPADTRSYEPVLEELVVQDSPPAKLPPPLLSPPPPPPPPPPPAGAAPPSAHLRPPSPTPGIIRLPSGMSIQLEDELQGRGRKRRRSSSSGDTGPRIHPPPACRPQAPVADAGTARLPPPPPPPPPPPLLPPVSVGSRPRPAPPVPAAPPTPPAPAPLPAPAAPAPVRPGAVSAGRPAPPPAAVTATATVSTSSGHKVIFVSSAGGTAAAAAAAAPPPRPAVPPTAEAGSGAAAERRLRPPAPVDPNTDTYRQLAGLDSTGVTMHPAGVGRARGRAGRRQGALAPATQQIRNATRVASGVKIITHPVPLGPAAGTKVVTKGGGQPLLVMPSSGPAVSRAAMTVGAVRTAAAGGRVVTVSSGPSRTVVRQPTLQGYALPRAVHVGRAPAAAAALSAKQPASVIVLQKSAPGRSPTVVRPARSRPEPPPPPPPPLQQQQPPQAVFVSAAPAAAAPGSGKQPALAPAAVQATPSPQDQKINNSTVLSDILHATGIINQKSPVQGGAASSRPAAPGSQKRSAAGPLQLAAAPPAGPDRQLPSPPPEQQQPPAEPERPPAAGRPEQQEQSETAPAADETLQSLSLEEAMDLLNKTASPEVTRQILRQAGIRLGEVDGQDGAVSAGSQASGDESLPVDPSMELVGELDPQTGIFYPVTQSTSDAGLADPPDAAQAAGGETLEDISAFLEQRPGSAVRPASVPAAEPAPGRGAQVAGGGVLEPP